MAVGCGHHAMASVGRRAAQTGHWHLAVRLAAKETADKRKEDKPEVDFLLFPQQSTAVNSSHGHEIASLGGPPGGPGSLWCSLQVFPHQLLYLLY